MKVLFSIIFFLFAILPSKASNDSLLIKDYQNKISTFSQSNKPDSLIFYHKKLKEFYFNQKDWINYLNSNNSISRTFYRSFKYEKAEETLLNNIDIINQGLVEKNHKYISSTYNILGSLYYHKGLYRRAIEYSEKSLQISLTQKELDKASIAALYSNIGVIYSSNNNFKKALNYHYQSLKIQTSLSGKRTFLSSIYLNIGKTHGNKKEYNTAIEYYNKAITELNKNPNKNAITVKTNKAITYQKIKQYQEALDILFEIVKDHKDYQRIDRINKHIGTTYYYMGNYAKALEFLNTSLSQKKKRYSTKHPNLAINYSAIGDVYLTLEEPVRALTYFQKSIYNLCLNFNDTTNLTNPNLEYISNKVALLEALRKKASALKNIQKYDDALETYLLSIKLNESIGYNHSDIESRNFQYEQTRSIYEKAIELAHQLYTETEDKTYLEKAFQIAEHSKSSLLVQSLQDTEAHHIGGVPTKLILQEKELAIEISFYENKLFKVKKKADKEKMEQALFTKREELDKLVRRLETEYPKYYEEKYTRNEISIADVQEQNGKDEVFVEYFYGTDAYYIIAIDNKKAQLIKKEYHADFEQHIERFLSTMDNKNLLQYGEKNYSNYIKSGTALYEALLAPLATMCEGKQLTISPDGKLSYIPFEALLTEKVSQLGADYRDIPYLLHKHAVHYAFSAGLHYKNQGQQNEYPHAYAGYAPSYTGGQLDQLIWNEKEIENAARILKGKAFTGDTASKSHFLENKDQYQILHLAMHASADSLNPMHSRLIFDDSSEEESLYAYELCNMNIGSELVVLSACETGAGQLINGEGVMSIARSFFYAGCPSVIMTQWQLDDKTSTQIMESFYQYLEDGENKSEALRLAKIDYINQNGPIRSNPLYWANIVAVGDPRPIRSKQAGMIWYLVIGFMIPIGMASYKAYNKRKSA